jgi:HD-GYP domain-containing protein (c-di-GMP phosphodiesterase class II)
MQAVLYGKRLKYLFILTCATAIIFPLVNIYYIFPSISKLVIDNIEDEARRIAQHLASNVVTEDNRLKERQDIEDAAGKIKTDFNLDKLKVFSAGGEIVYSTDPADIGEINTKPYFHEIVSRGNVHTTEIQQGTRTLEDKIVEVDVVETYVPIMSGSQFLGAFEIYYDITRQNQTHNQTVFRASLIFFALVFIFYIANVIVLLQADRETAGLQAGTLSKIYSSPIYLLTVILVSIYAVHFILMLAMSALPPLPALTRTLLDSALLILLLSPLLYFFLLRPLLLHISMRRKAESDLKKSHSELEKRVDERTAELSRAYDKTIEGWSRAMDMRDKETEGHLKRATEMTLRIALELEVDGQSLVYMKRGALLHDMGKMGIPDSILHKPGPLTEEEWKIMKSHPEYAYGMLFPIEHLRSAIDIPLYHHEKWDGSGYPCGLKGKAIPLAARIFAVVDVWDALRSDRPYRHAWTEEKVIDHIRSCAGSHFDPEVVEVFLKMDRQKLQDHNIH